jgi:hypothetical protein
LYFSALQLILQRSEQYFTSSQTFSHFLRQVKGRWQWTQILLGRLAFLIIFIGQYLREILKL